MADTDSNSTCSRWLRACFARRESSRGQSARSGSACCESCEHYTLDRARTGEELEIVEVGDDHARIQTLRFGMCEGSCVTCVTRIPAGPLVLRSGRQEIAVGRNLAKRIRVRRLSHSVAQAPTA